VSRDIASDIESSETELPAALAIRKEDLVSPLQEKLALLKYALDHDDTRDVFELVKQILALRDATPDLRARLGRVVIARVLMPPEDLESTLGLFGTTRLDPNGYRSQALAHESRRPDEAVNLWFMYLATFDEVRGISAPASTRP
jgi:hypothetical protein